MQCLYVYLLISKCKPLQWRHNGRGGVSNHQPHNCLLSRLFGRRSMKTSKFRVTGLYAGNSPVTGEFPAQMASNAEKVSIWWRHTLYFSLLTLNYRCSFVEKKIILMREWILSSSGWIMVCCLFNFNTKTITLTKANFLSTIPLVLYFGISKHINILQKVIYDSDKY